ncbi:MAG TPA: nicotinate-nucleotide adenylyltransferase, partial [Longimicrobiaceae bacterium]|nr:nicotinate-nucleotide adenylyltransferase [Longimicrobiaceae bacterium]
MRVGLLGGTFDPPHLGHLIAASEACAALDLERIVFIPSAQPPHKRGRVEASAEQRLRMVRAAVADDPRFAVDDLELRRPGASYTVDTLRELKARDPGAELFFLIGADQLRELSTWHQPEEVLRLAHLVGFARSGDEVEPQEGVEVIHVTRLDLSSTDLRRRVRQREPIRYLVPEGVREII